MSAPPRLPGHSPDLRLWERVTTAYRTAAGVVTGPAPGSDARTNAARRDTEARVRATELGVAAVDLYVDPVCPYTWLAACWLREVERHRDLDLRYHPMSLRMLNQHRVLDAGYRATVERTAGPSRIATAVWVHLGADAFRAWHTTFGSAIFDHWRYPSRRQYRAAAEYALVSNGLPTSLVQAADTEEYDEPLRRSHLEGTAPVGVDGGTPVIHVGGVAYFGPVLNAIPTTEEALSLFDAVVLLARCRDFFELKRTRTSPPVFAHSGRNAPDAADGGGNT